jgi:hypothetical protein
VVAGLLQVRKGLCSLFLGGSLIEVILCGCLLCAVEFEDGVNPNRSGLYALVFGVLKLALDLDMSALLELGGEVSQLPKDDKVMPLGTLNVLAGLFVLAGLRCGKAKGDELLVVFVGANDRIAAEEAHEFYFVLVHFVSPFLNFPILLGSHRAKPSEWGRLPSAKRLLFGGDLGEVCAAFCAAALKLVLGGTGKAGKRRAAGRRFDPEAVTEKEAGYRGETHCTAKELIHFLTMLFTDKAGTLSASQSPAKRPASWQVKPHVFG